MSSEFGGGNVTAVVCDEISTEYDGVLAGLCATLCVFGLVYVFFGYRCFSAVMFLSGLIFGGTTVFLMCREERIFQQQFSMEIAAGIAAGIGVLCGFITMLVRYVGLFLQGFFLGLLIAVAGILALQAFYSPSTAWIPVGILFGVGILFSLLTLKFQRVCIIISTAVLGSALIAVCIDYFLEQFLLLKYIWEALMAADNMKVCWYTWVILGVWPILAFAGALLQWKVTSKGFDHTDVIITRGRHKQVRTHLVRERRHRSTSRTTAQANQGRSSSRTTAQANQGRSEAPRSSAQANRSRSSSRGRRGAHSEERRRVREVAPPTNAPPPTNVAPSAPSGGANSNPAAVANDDDLPTYFECVELGVGEPVQEQHQVVRTDKGAFVANLGAAEPSGTIQDQILRGLDTGHGHDPAPAPGNPPAASGYLGNAETRRSQRQTGASNPDREDIANFAPQRPGQKAKVRPKSGQPSTTTQSNNSEAVSRSASARGQGQSASSGQGSTSAQPARGASGTRPPPGPTAGSGARGQPKSSSKRFKRSTRGNQSARRPGQPVEGDTQRLLSKQRSSHGDAVAAHARRLMAAQNRRQSLPTTTSQSPMRVAPSADANIV